MRTADRAAERVIIFYKLRAPLSWLELRRAWDEHSAITKRASVVVVQLIVACTIFAAKYKKYNLS
jgi:hypothetical protein